MSAYSHTAGTLRAYVQSLDPTVDSDKNEIRRLTAHLVNEHGAGIGKTLSMAQKQRAIVDFIDKNPMVHFEIQLEELTTDEPATEPTPVPDTEPEPDVRETADEVNSEPETPAPDPVADADANPEPDEQDEEADDRDKELLLGLESQSYLLKHQLKRLYGFVNFDRRSSKDPLMTHGGNWRTSCEVTIETVRRFTAWLTDTQPGDAESMRAEFEIKTDLATPQFNPNQATSQKLETEERARWTIKKIAEVRELIVRGLTAEGIDATHVAESTTSVELYEQVMAAIKGHPSPIIEFMNPTDITDEPAAPAAAPTDAGQPVEEEDVSLSVRFHSEVVGNTEEEKQDQSDPLPLPAPDTGKNEVKFATLGEAREYVAQCDDLEDLREGAEDLDLDSSGDVEQVKQRLLGYLDIYIARYGAEAPLSVLEEEVQDQPEQTSRPVYARQLPVSIGEPIPDQALAPLRFVGPSTIRLTEGEANVRIQLHAEGGQRPYFWNWEQLHGFYLVPDGRLGSYRILSEDVGEHTVHIVVTDSLGNQSEADIHIEILPLEKPTEVRSTEEPTASRFTFGDSRDSDAPDSFRFTDPRRDDAPAPFTWTSRDEDAVHTGGFTREDTRDPFAVEPGDATLTLILSRMDELARERPTHDQVNQTVQVAEARLNNAIANATEASILNTAALTRRVDNQDRSLEEHETLLGNHSRYIDETRKDVDTALGLIHSASAGMADRSVVIKAAGFAGVMAAIGAAIYWYLQYERWWFWIDYEWYPLLGLVIFGIPAFGIGLLMFGWMNQRRRHNVTRAIARQEREQNIPQYRPVTGQRRDRNNTPRRG